MDVWTFGRMNVWVFGVFGVSGCLRFWVCGYVSVWAEIGLEVMLIMNYSAKERKKSRKGSH